AFASPQLVPFRVNVFGSLSAESISAAPSRIFRSFIFSAIGARSGLVVSSYTTRNACVFVAGACPAARSAVSRPAETVVITMSSPLASGGPGWRSGPARRGTALQRAGHCLDQERRLERLLQTGHIAHAATA